MVFTMVINKKGKIFILILTILLILLTIILYMKKENNIINKSTNELNDRDLRDVANLKNKKVIMITFDDGPAETTSILLDELKKRDAKVTFFMVGNKIKRHPDIVKRAYEEGHSISNHSYSHKDLRNLSKKKLLNEINKTNELLRELGIENKYLRPPYGFSNNRVFKTSNMSFIYWNIDPHDWKYQNASLICKKIIDKASDGSIVILHDIFKTSIEGAIMAIDKLLEEGYAIISLKEAEELGYINPDKNKKYYDLK